MRILVAEDDSDTAEFIQRGLGELGHNVIVAPDGLDALHLITLEQLDVAILDRMLPRLDGVSVLRRARAAGIEIPVLLLTALGRIDDRVGGLEAGADDYLVKPFAFRELSARVHALSRRQPALVETKHRFADLEVDLRAHHVRRANRGIELTSKEFALLEFFVLHANEVVDRAAITAKVWDENHDPTSKVVDVLVARVRRKIDDGYEPKLIHTMRGDGYQFGEEPR